MNDLILDIVPKNGLGQIRFGDSSEKVVGMLGQPEDVENIEDVDEFNTVILYYWNRGVTIFFEGSEKSVVSCFEIENKKATMYGNQVFEMSEKDVLSMMNSRGFEVAEKEKELTGENRISYDDAMIDFFFKNSKLVAVNWGVLVNNKGEVEEM